MKTDDCIRLSREIRIKTLEMVYNAKASHIGGAFSMADVIAVLYESVLNIDPSNPNDISRDRFLLSKGHACTALYSVLALKEFFPITHLATYSQNKSNLLSHASHKVPGVEFSTGSLGHALPVSTGIALGLKIKGHKNYIYTLLSDGELDEGSNWEALLFIQHHKLTNLITIIDYNKIQSFGTTAEVINLDPLKDKLIAFNFDVIEIDGHNHSEILDAFHAAKINKLKPTIILANTIKGKGVPFMENELLWHYKSPTKEQYDSAIKILTEQI